MKKLRMGVAAIAGLIAAGCAGMAGSDPGRRPGADAGVSAQACTYNPGYQPGDNCCILPTYVTALDVDTAFSRALKTYRFPTKVAGAGRNPERLYRFHSVRGEYHSAANDVWPQGDQRLGRGLWLFLTLERETSTSSSVAAVYCEIPGQRPQDPAAWHAAVQNSIRATVPPR